MAYEVKGIALGTTSPTQGQIAGNTIKANTQLESHLSALRDLHNELGSAATRAMQLADRLIGSEPSPIANVGREKEPGEPPLLTRLERASIDASELAKSIHYHLNRLERL